MTVGGTRGKGFCLIRNGCLVGVHGSDDARRGATGIEGCFEGQARRLDVIRECLKALVYTTHGAAPGEGVKRGKEKHAKEGDEWPWWGRKRY